MHTARVLDSSVCGSVGVKTGFFAKNETRDVTRAEVQLPEVCELGLKSRRFNELIKISIQKMLY